MERLMPKTTPEGDVELSREEIVRLVDQGARSRRGISGEQLIREFRAGRLPEPCEVLDLLSLASLLAESDPYFAPIAA
jgi:hypothetical protein